MILVQAEDLSVSYDSVPALAPLSLSVPTGARVGVIGRSGSGKSTLVTAVADLLPSGATKTGRVTWPGRPSPARAGADIGVVFQDAAGSLDPLMTIGAQVREVIETHLPLRGTAAQARAVDLLAQVDLPDPQRAAALWPHQLSGGQRQRVALACALAADPVLLIADEMSSALDTLTQARIIALLERLVRTRRMTLLFITHDVAVAAQLADRLIVMENGVAVEQAATGHLLDSPRHAATQTLLRAHLDLRAPPLIGQRP